MDILYKFFGMILFLGEEEAWCNGRQLVRQRSSLWGTHRLPAIDMQTPDWRAWVSHHAVLNYRYQQLYATLRKERRGNRDYWYGYRYGVGKGESVKIYIGKLEIISARRLLWLMQQLHEHARERKAMTEAERARRKRRAACARQRRYRRRHKQQQEQRHTPKPEANEQDRDDDACNQAWSE